MGQIARRATISNITNANPCVITTTEAHGFLTSEFVRLTSLNGAKQTPPAAPHGSDPLNNYRFRIVKIDDLNFKIQYPVTQVYVDSTNFTPYITGGDATIVETNFVYYNDNEE